MSTTSQWDLEDIQHLADRLYITCNCECDLIICNHKTRREFIKQGSKEFSTAIGVTMRACRGLPDNWFILGSKGKFFAANPFTHEIEEMDMDVFTYPARGL